MAATLFNLSELWEASSVVRDRVRAGAGLFQAPEDQSEMSASVKCAEGNLDVLVPLVQELRDGEGCLKMAPIPALVAQRLVWTNFHSFVLLWIWMLDLKAPCR